MRPGNPKKSGIPGSGTGSGLRTRTRNPVKKTGTIVWLNHRKDFDGKDSYE